jgi:hypothetical protein
MDGGPRVEKAGIYVDFKFPFAYQQTNTRLEQPGTITSKLFQTTRCKNCKITGHVRTHASLFTPLYQKLTVLSAVILLFIFLVWLRM